uniref:RNA helicase n=1 Tax=Araucaria cunninghamii TaxID=56994 RepID=A0A0D6R2A3_ARACU
MEDSEEETGRISISEPAVFSKGALKQHKKKSSQPQQPSESQLKPKNPNADAETTSFEDLGLSEWAVQICRELGMKEPTSVQKQCIPQIIKGKDVMGLAQTGSGKTAAFALPILHKLAQNPYGVFALVITPTRELAFQLAEQFKALGAPLHLRCTVIIGGMNMITQAQTLMQRPHVVIATPGRIRSLLTENPDVPKVFSRAKFLVLDEADRVLDVGFEEELKVIFKCMPRERQTLLFSATMTGDLRALHELSGDKAYFYEAYEGFKTVESLKQQYVFVPENVKDVYFVHIVSSMEEKGIRSAIIFVSTCRTCHLLSLLLEEVGMEAVALHSLKTQSSRLGALHRFKSGQVPVLLATDVASRGLDIPTVDLVINYDIPRYPRDYVHRVGRTARAGRGGQAVSIVTQYQVKLVHEIEAVIGKQLEEYDCREDDVLKDITKVYKAKRTAAMRMMDDGFEEKVKEKKETKLKMLVEKGLLEKEHKKRKKRSTEKEG